MEKIISSYSEQNKRKIISTYDYWIEYESGPCLDLQCGNAAYVFGYSDEEILNAIRNNKINFIRNGVNETSESVEKIVEQLLRLSNMSAISWAVSGSDAVESAVAMNFRYWEVVDPNKTQIVSLYKNYHGSTFLEKCFRKEYNIPQVTQVNSPFWTDIEDRQSQELKTLTDLEILLETNNKVGCVIIESIPWIDGIVPFSNSFWKLLRALCNKYNINLLLDDVAGCFGKIGESFSYRKWGIEPDLVAIGKSFTGGYIPFSASFANKKIHEELKKIEWDHTHTWNPCAVGVAAASVVLDKVDNGAMSVMNNLEIRIKQLLDKLEYKTRGNGLVWDIFLDEQVNWTNLVKHNLSFNIYNDYTLPIIVPVIADDNYFNILEEKLIAIRK